MRKFNSIKYILLIVFAYSGLLMGQPAVDPLDRANELLFSGRADTALQIIESELSGARSSKDLKREVRALERMAVWHLFSGNNTRGLEFLNEGILKAEKLPDSLQLALLLGNRAYELAQNNLFEDAIRDILRAQDIFISKSDTMYMLNGYNTIGYIYSLSGQPEKAEPYYVKELELAQAGNYKKELSIAYDNLAILYGELERDSQIIKSFHKKSLALAYEIDDPEGKASGNSNLANYYLKHGKLDSAEWHSLEAIRIASEIEFYDLIQEVNLTLSAVYLQKGRFAEAVDMATQVLEQAEANGNVDHQTKALNILSKGYFELGIFDSAYIFLDKLKVLEDEFKGEKTLRNIQELEAKYENSKKEILLQKSRIQIARRTNLIILISFALLLVLSLFIWWRRNAIQKVRLKDAQIRQMAQEHEIEVLNSLVEGEEKERSRIAKELHDGVNGMLTAIKLNVEEGQVENGTSLGEMVERTMAEVRNISHNLMPANLLQFGLPDALRDYTDQIRQSGKLDVDLVCLNLEERLKRTVELSVYRIVQELMNNIVRHSGATQALIQLSREGDMLYLTVEDNGRGFSPATGSTGIGLQSLNERVQILNGKMEFESSKEMGTSVHIEIQLQR